jgi:hypothetical protein
MSVTISGGCQCHVLRLVVAVLAAGNCAFDINRSARSNYWEIISVSYTTPLLSDVSFTSHIVQCLNTVRSESRCALKLRGQACVEDNRHHFQHFYKCTTTFRTQICRKCLRIKLNGFRSV